MSSQLNAISTCTACGRSTEDVSGFEVQTRRDELLSQQIYKLEQLLQTVEEGRITIEQLREQIPQMCNSCQMLLDGVSKDAERMELISRLRRDIKELQELRAEPIEPITARDFHQIPKEESRPSRRVA